MSSIRSLLLAIWLPAGWPRPDTEAAAEQHREANDAPVSPEHDRPDRCLTDAEHAAWLSLTASLEADKEPRPRALQHDAQRRPELRRLATDLSAACPAMLRPSA